MSEYKCPYSVSTIYEKYILCGYMQKENIVELDSEYKKAKSIIDGNNFLKITLEQ